MYTIKEMSALFGVPASTIRYYEEIGLLENVEHVNGYRRQYTKEHIARMSAIDCLKKARLSLEDIKRIFAYEKDIPHHAEDMLELLRKQEASTREELQDLQFGLEHVQRKIRYYTLVNQAVQEGKEPPKWKDIQ